MPSVGIILLNWNGQDLTKDCLDCFRAFNHTYQLIVVDNHSTDDSLNFLLANYPEVHFIPSDINLGFAGGNNLGISYCLEAGLDYILLLNNDTLFDEDFIQPMIQKMESDLGLGAIQPKILFNHDRTLVWNAGGAFHPWIAYSKTIGEAKPDSGIFNLEREIDWITGCCILVRREVIERVGLLDERFFIYHEDVDWSLRMRSKGYRLLYSPKSHIYHIAGATGKSKTKEKEGFVSPITHYRNYRNRFWVVRKNLSLYYWPTAALFHIVQIMLISGYFVVRRRFKKLRAISLGLKHSFGKIKAYHS